MPNGGEIGNDVETICHGSEESRLTVPFPLAWCG